MTTTPRRNATILDVALLVGLAAVGLAAYQWVHQSPFPGWIWLLDLGVPGKGEWSALRVLVTCSDLTSMLISIVGPWTVLLLVLRLARVPVARWRRAWRKPGIAACLAAVLAACWTGLALLTVLAMEHVDPGRVARPSHVWARKYLADEIFMYLGAAVAVTWLVQALSGRWKRPVDWIDRMGRLVGAAWILIGFV
ncbi:MAG: hypothetical protein U0790_21090 [Isosphaeraceae bacterium]